MPDRWIQKTIKRKSRKYKPRGKGALTAEAERHGMTVSQFIKHVTKNPDKYNKITKQRVNLAKTLIKLSKRKSKKSNKTKKSKKSKK